MRIVDKIKSTKTIMYFSDKMVPPWRSMRDIMRSTFDIEVASRSSVRFLGFLYRELIRIRPNVYDLFLHFELLVKNALKIERQYFFEIHGKRRKHPRLTYNSIIKAMLQFLDGSLDLSLIDPTYIVALKYKNDKDFNKYFEKKNHPCSVKYKTAIANEKLNEVVRGSIETYLENQIYTLKEYYDGLSLLRPEYYLTKIKELIPNAYETSVEDTVAELDMLEFMNLFKTFIPLNLLRKDEIKDRIRELLQEIIKSLPDNDLMIEIFNDSRISSIEIDDLRDKIDWFCTKLNLEHALENYSKFKSWKNEDFFTVR